jgi:hypothetical protein
MHTDRRHLLPRPHAVSQERAGKPGLVGAAATASPASLLLKTRASKLGVCVPIAARSSAKPHHWMPLVTGILIASPPLIDWRKSTGDKKGTLLSLLS